MSNDHFLDRLRDDSRTLQYQPQDDSIWTRLPAKIRARMQQQPATASQLLAAWFRPIAASLTALALAATLGLAWFDRPQPVTSPDSVTSAGMDIQMDGDLYHVGD